MIQREKITLDDVIKIVSRYANASFSQLSENTRLGEDLCIIGDDAEEFISEYSKEFEIDMSNFELQKYFPSEASADMHNYISDRVKNKSFFMRMMENVDGWFWKMLSSNRDYKTLTLEKLLICARIGIWED